MNENMLIDKHRLKIPKNIRKIVKSTREAEKLTRNTKNVLQYWIRFYTSIQNLCWEIYLLRGQKKCVFLQIHSLAINAFWLAEAKRRRDTWPTSCCTCPFECCRVRVPRPDKVRRLFGSRTDLGTSTPLGL